MKDHATTTATAPRDSLHSALSLLVPAAAALASGSYFGDPLAVVFAVGLGSLTVGFVSLALRRGDAQNSAGQIGLGAAVLSAGLALL